MLVTTVYDMTPLFAINALMIGTIVYVLYKGLEVLARTAEIHLIILICLGGLGNVLVLVSGIIDLNNLFPLLGNGWGPIFKEAYPRMLMFPYGEAICFTTILPFLNKRRLARKTGIAALIFSGTSLSITHAVEIPVLGVNIYSRSTFPLFTVSSKVNIAGFLERVDGIAILVLIIGDFYKIAVYCFAAVLVASDLFKVKQQQKLVLPVGIWVLFSSMMIAIDFSEQMEEGKLTTNPPGRNRGTASRAC